MELDMMSSHDVANRGVFAVVGATGQQGGATARSLLVAGAGVRALVRDTNSAAASSLAEAGAELARADIEDVESLRAAFAGVAGLFAMTTMTGPGGTDGEVELGRSIGDAARDAAVPHVVYSSVGGAERGTGIPHFESKRRVEEHLVELGLSTTFVRPTFFMDNFASSGPHDEDGVLVLRSPSHRVCRCRWWRSRTSASWPPRRCSIPAGCRVAASRSPATN